MNKWFITFCALGLISTQVPTADAASNNEEGQNTSVQSMVKVVNPDQYENALNKFLSNCSLTDEASIKDLANKLSISTIKLEELLASKVQEEAKQNTEQAEKVTVPSKNETTNKEVVKTPAPTKEQKEVTAPAAKPATNNNTAAPTTNNNVAQKPATPAAENGSVSAFEEKVIELTNAERAKQGLKPLEMYAPLMSVARAKSADMAKNNYFSHTSPTYGSPFDQMKAAGISYKAAGENIAQGQRTPEEVVQAWMNSEGHRANIMNANFTHIGVGYVADGNHWTQQFIQL